MEISVIQVGPTKIHPGEVHAPQICSFKVC